MNIDFHYYATYCAAYLAGYSHNESLDICYSAQFVDCCSKSFLDHIDGPEKAATTQLQLELINHSTDVFGLQDITRIWSSFHFLPGNLNTDFKRNKTYKQKYQLICKPNSELLKDTVELAHNQSLQHVGMAMHILADTWAHQNFAGTPSLVVNNTTDYFYEIKEDGQEIKINFNHNPATKDKIEKLEYTNSVYTSNENSVMNLGHGRAGHLPDYSFIKYKYLPAWNDYNELIKDNPSDYWHAFCQMVYAMKYCRNDFDTFELDTYAFDQVEKYKEEIQSIFNKRQLDDSLDFKKLAETISGQTIPDFDLNLYVDEYLTSSNKDETFLGKFINAALKQKGMVTTKIFNSGNKLAGISVSYHKSGLQRVKDFIKLHTTKKVEV